MTSTASPLKLALDHAEFVERVSELQPKATRVEQRLNSRGGYILILPRHAAVINYAGERAHFDHGCAHDSAGRPLIDLASAERNFAAACDDVDSRTFGRVSGLQNKIFSLSSIIEAIAAARYWFKIIGELEYFARIERQNRRARLGLRPITTRTRKLVRRYLRQSAPTPSTSAMWERNK